MSTIGHTERATQNRVITLFRNELNYHYLGNWQDRPQKTGQPNSNIEETLLTDHLTRQGHSPTQITAALYKLRTTATNPNLNLYDNNKATYALLRYGIQVKTSPSEPTETIPLINWQTPSANHFAIAEEVTIQGKRQKRPDIVLYINGIAISILELKNSRVSIGDGIRQSLTNQKPEFIGPFFSTIQLILAGNDSEGLRYGTIGTEEQYFLTWKEDEQDNDRYKLDKYLLKLCDKHRLIDLLHNFILFDGGIKKLPRCHQYFGIKAAQHHIRNNENGIIWHTQGSGKSITMVLLAKWTLENNPNARIVIVTDRDELDKQIEGVFTDAGETIYRTNSGRDLITQLGKATPRLLCSLVHKFGKRDIKDFEAFIRDLARQPSPSVGEIFVFVDECHRTQSGKLHRTMSALMPTATFIGFTGTPLLKKDKATSIETFGNYIHTYKFSEAVTDAVVLDLIYEARDIDQTLGSEDKIDAWFDAKTKGLNDWRKAALREQWGTMQKVLSSRSRMDRVVSDIIFDFSVKPRLSDDRGNAILVASSIYEACKYYELLQKTAFKGKCAIVTSYNPQSKDITTEDTGANTETDKEFIYNLYTAILQNITAQPNKTKTEAYEEQVKSLFKKQPANMKLLVVVDKLLTGFDAPSCTFLYIDKSMQDHGLFQAICRVNRLDGDDKEFGYIVDYKDLFKKVENAISVYTSELDHSDLEGPDPQILLQDRLTKGSDRLDDALEALHLICEPVQPPRDELAYLRYFCGNTEIPDDLKTTEPQRIALYKGVAALVRSYANIADELAAAGYSPADITRIQQDTKKYTDLRESIRKASGETIDLKPYEAGMRHLIDTYIEASEPRKISPFDDMPLLDLIVKTGIANAISTLPSGIKSNSDAIAETIENNVRRTIVKESLSDPAYYANMSALLDEIIAARKQKAIAYEDYLKKVAQLAKTLEKGHLDGVPEQLKNPGQRALYNNLLPKSVPAPEKAAEVGVPYTASYENEALELAIKIDHTVKQIRPDDWRGNQSKEQQIKAALYGILQDVDEVNRIFLIIEQNAEY
jgi:type I restriction enzyme, R subunit